MNTSSKKFSDILQNTYFNNQENIENLSKKNGINYLKIRTDKNYIPLLIKLFRIRNKYK